MHIANSATWNHGTAEPSLTQKHICSWSLKLIFCSFEVLMSTSKLQNMKFKLQLEILFQWYALDKNLGFHGPPLMHIKKNMLIFSRHFDSKTNHWVDISDSTYRHALSLQFLGIRNCFENFRKIDCGFFSVGSTKVRWITQIQ